MNVIFGKVYIYFNDDMYYVVRIIKEEDKPVIDTWKEHLHCDIALRKEGSIYFCRKVNELEVIEDEQI